MASEIRVSIDAHSKNQRNLQNTEASSNFYLSTLDIQFSNTQWMTKSTI